MKDLIKKHRDAVTKLGYTKEQADDIIHRLSAIMNAFIDAAWGVHPAQVSMKAGSKKSLLPKARCDIVLNCLLHCTVIVHLFLTNSILQGDRYAGKTYRT